MKKIVLFICFNSTLICTKAQIKTGILNTEHKKELAGKVKSCTTTEYIITKSNNSSKKIIWSRINVQFDIKDNIIEESKINENNNLLSKVICKYDTLTNNLIEENTIYPEIYNNIKIEKTYSKSNKLVKERKYKADTILQEEIFYQYNDLGLLEEKSSKRGKININKTIYTYNNQNILIEEVSFDGFGKKINSVNYSYDNNKNLTLHELHNGEGRLKSSDNWKYDRNKNIIQEEIITEDNNKNDIFNKNKIIFYKYDDKNNLVETCSGKPNSGLPQKCDVYKYEEIDKTGNWHLKNTIKNNKIYKITEREIEYYQ